jgi:small nuclear ribonucleoprotein (snRNP)-like protein
MDMGGRRGTVTIMSVLQSKLQDIHEGEVVVVTKDGRAFRGTLDDYDDECLVLEDVVEGTTENGRGWEEPTVSTGYVEKVVTWQGVYNHGEPDADVVRLQDVVLRLDGVLRFWAWNEDNVGVPDHIEVDSSPSPQGKGPNAPKKR